MQKAEAAARIDVSERTALSAKDQQRLRSWALGHARSDIGQLALDLGRQGIGVRGHADASAERPDGLGDVGQTLVCIRVEGNLGALELALQLGLRAVHDDEVWPQGQNALDVGIDERPHTREALDFWRIVGVGAGGDQPVTGRGAAVDCGERDEGHRDDDACRPGLTRPGWRTR